MTTTRITQIFNNTSPLQAASRTHCEYTLYITRSALALCAEAAFTPQYALTHNTLGSIVSRIYILITKMISKTRKLREKLLWQLLLKQRLEF